MLAVQVVPLLPQQNPGIGAIGPTNPGGTGGVQRSLAPVWQQEPLTTVPVQQIGAIGVVIPGAVRGVTHCPVAQQVPLQPS